MSTSVRLGIRGDSGHVAVVVLADVLEVAEEKPVRRKIE